MLLNYRNILICLSAISTALCDGPQSSDDGILISDFSPTSEYSEHEPPLIADSGSTLLTSTKSSTGYGDGTPVDIPPVTWELFESSGDDADEEFMSLFSFRIFDIQSSSNTNTVSTTSPSSTTSSVKSLIGAANPIQVALKWSTSPTTSTSSGATSASATSNSSKGSKSPHHTTTTSTTTTTTTDPAETALDWLTSSLDDKGATTEATTTDSKHSSAVSAITSEAEATHTSAAAANRMGPKFW